MASDHAQTLADVLQSADSWTFSGWHFYSDFQRPRRSGNVPHAPKAGCSSIFLRRMIGSMFMRVNSKCAHQVRPPPGHQGASGTSVLNSPGAICEVVLRGE